MLWLAIVIAVVGLLLEIWRLRRFVHGLAALFPAKGTGEITDADTAAGAGAQPADSSAAVRPGPGRRPWHWW